MPNVFEIESLFMLVVAFALLGVKIFALVSALIYSGESYEAAGKLSKPAWCGILGLGVVAAVVFPGSPIGLINLAFTIAAFVYLADVRPALSSLTRR